MARVKLLRQELDLAGVHSALLPNGKVLFFAADPPRENDVNVSLYQLWNEETGPASGGSMMANKRFMGDAVIMADGTILLVNGAEKGAADHSGEPVMETELFDPDSETWTTSESLRRRRMYHSAALLLPSGRVLIAGNTERWNPENKVEEKAVELFIPDYADSDSRPTITSAPEEIFYGASFQISTPNASNYSAICCVFQHLTAHLCTPFRAHEAPLYPACASSRRSF